MDCFLAHRYKDMVLALHNAISGALLPLGSCVTRLAIRELYEDGANPEEQLDPGSLSITRI